MYLLYLDDSGSVGNKDERNFILGGLCCYENNIHGLKQKLDNYAEEVVRKYQLDCSAEELEFHASAIWSGKDKNGNWSKVKEKGQKIEIIKNVLKIFADSHGTIKAFACVVDRESNPNVNPVEMAFQDLTSRFETFLRSFAGNKGLIILDKSKDESMILDLSRMYRKHGTKWRKIYTLPEVPLFVDSRDSRLIQFADHIAYAVSRSYERHDNSYLDIIHKRFVHNKKLHNLAHKTRKTCFCSACSSRR